VRTPTTPPWPARHYAARHPKRWAGENLKLSDAVAHVEPALLWPAWNGSTWPAGVEPNARPELTQGARGCAASLNARSTKFKEPGPEAATARRLGILLADRGLVSSCHGPATCHGPASGQRLRLLRRPARRPALGSPRPQRGYPAAAAAAPASNSSSEDSGPSAAATAAAAAAAAPTPAPAAAVRDTAAGHMIYYTTATAAAPAPAEAGPLL
jgi:hypothetical protein